MNELIAQGTWVQIHQIVLPPNKRAPQVPRDTQEVPLEMTVKGYLVESARIGEEAEILTMAGRRLRGTLKEVNPAYTHSFGPPIPELLSIGREIRDSLREQGEGT